MTTKGTTLTDITAADFRAARAHLARVLATISRVLEAVDPSVSNADALSADINADHVLTYLDACADRLDAADAAEDDRLAADAAEAAMLAVDEKLGDLYWDAYDAAKWGPRHRFGIRAVRERLALVAEWLIAEARWEERIGSKNWATHVDTQDDYALSPGSPAVADATPRVWDNIVDVPNNIRVTDRYRVEWRWDGAWEWLSVITGDWIMAGFSERREFAPFTEVI